MDERLSRAFSFAFSAHEGQTRDDGITPYIVHPIGTLRNLTSIAECKDIDLMCVALLHDTVEDGQTSQEELLDEFGGKITLLVSDLTLPLGVTPNGKIEFLSSLMRNGSLDAILVKLCDRLDNIRDMNTWNEKQRRRYLDQTYSMINTLVANRQYGKEIHNVVRTIMTVK